MSNVIDNEIVKMDFDNTSFERNVRTSLKTIDNLKNSLSFNGVEDGFGKIEEAAGKVKMNPLEKSIEKIKLSFDALDVVAFTVLQNITNRVIRTATKMVNAITLAPIKDGFKEYETQMNSVQTILANTASKGTTLRQVNNALDTLNTYADKTIYNFTEMTKNIGTFTAAGVDLQTSVDSIQGIANLAAVSGANSQKASVAMYQLSQAIAAGSVKLMDWNSVVNAGMGGEVFQHALIRTSELLGTGAKAAIKAEGSFRESLHSGWLTVDVLTETLKQFALAVETEEEYKNAVEDLVKQGYTKEQAKQIADMAKTASDAATKVKTFTQLIDTLKEALGSGWTKTWQLILGDFEQAKEMYTKISDVLGGIIDKVSDARNAMLTEGLADSWTQFLSKGVTDEEAYIEKIKEVAKEHNVAIDEILKDGKNFKDSLKEGWLTADIMKEALENLVKETDNLSASELKAKGMTLEQVRMLKKLREEIQNGTVNLQSYVKAFSELSGRDNIMEGLGRIFTSIGNIGKAIGDGFVSFKKHFSESGKSLYSFTERFNNFSKEHFVISEKRLKQITNITKAVDSMLSNSLMVGGKVFKILSNVFKLFEPAVDIISNITAKIAELFGAVNNDIFSNGNVERFLDNVDKQVGNIVTNITNGITDFYSFVSGLDFTWITDIYVGTKKIASQFYLLFKNIVKGTFEIGSSVTRLLSNFATSGFVEFIRSTTISVNNLISSGFQLIPKIIDSIGNALSKLNFHDLSSFIAGFSFADLAFSIGKLVKQVNNSFNSFEGLGKNLTKMFSNLGTMLDALTKKVNADALGSIAKSLGLLAGSLVLMSLVDPQKVINSTGALGFLLAEMSIVITKMSSSLKKSASALITSRVFIEISKALLVSALALKVLGNMELKQAVISVSAIGAILAMIAGFSKSISQIKRINSYGKELISISISLGIFAFALNKISKIKFTSLVKSVGAFAGIMTILLGFFKLMSFGKDAKYFDSKIIQRIGKNLINISISLEIFAFALDKISKIKFTSLAKSVLAMGAILGEIAAFMHLIPTKGAMLKATSMIAISTSIVILASAFKILQNVTTEQLKVSLIAIGGLLLELSIALNMMASNGTLKGALALQVASVSLAMLVPVIAALGALPISVIAKGLGTIATAFIILGTAAALIAPLTPVLTKLTLSMIGFSGAVVLFGAGLTAIGVGLTAISAGISAVLLSIQGNIISFIGSIKVIGESLISLIPDFISSLVSGIVKSLSLILDGLDDLTRVLAKAIVGVINSLAEYAPDFIKATMKLIAGLASGLTEALKEMDTSTIVTIVTSLLGLPALFKIINISGAMATKAAGNAIKIGLVLVEIGAIISAFGALAKIPGINNLIDNGGKLLESLGHAIGSFFGGIAGGVSEGFASSLPSIGTSMSKFMINLSPFMDGIKTITPDSANSAKLLAETILIITATNVLQGLTAWLTGSHNMEAFANDLKTLGPALADYSKSISEANINPAAVETSVNAAKMLAGFAKEIPKSGGLFSIFAGNHDIKKFGEDLSLLGKGIGDYYSEISKSNVSKESIDISVNALKGLGEFSNTLSYSGGLSSLFKGNKDVSLFASNLKSLGTGLKEYYEEIKDIASNKLKEIVSCIKPFFELPEYKESKLEGLSTDLKSMMHTFSDVSSSIANFESDKMHQFVDFFSSLVSQIKSLNESDGLNFEKFTEGFKTLAETNFNTFKETVDSKIPEMIECGHSLITNLAKGATEKIDVIKTTFTNMLNNVLNLLRSKYRNFKTAGGGIIVAISSGMNSKKHLISSAMDSIVSYAVRALSNCSSKFEEAGKDAVLGFCNGISKNTFRAEAEAAEMADAARRAAKRELKERSPSKVFYQLGAFAVEGFANAFSDGTSIVEERSKNLAKMSIDTIGKAINNLDLYLDDNMEFSPTITPIVDLSDIDSKLATISASFENHPALRISEEIQNEEQFGRGSNSKQRNIINNYSFVQNNTSPKALSNIDIYRQTKNQLSMLRKRRDN